MSDFQLFDTTNSIDHELPEGETLVGRGADCDIRLISSSVSRKHGQFDVTGNVLTFSDLGSSNGSFVNGQAVKEPVELHNGDELSMGELHFSVSGGSSEADAGADDDATQMLGGDATEMLGDGGVGHVGEGVVSKASGAGGHAAGDAAIPGTWSDTAGLEQASGTQMGYFDEASENEGAAAYRAGKLTFPPIGNTPRLVGLNGGIVGQMFALAEVTAADEDGVRTWKLGRDADSVDLVIGHVNVSGQHAQIINDGERWKIVNWMSTNGTFVNGQKGLSTYLQNGDVISMGGAELAFELPVTAADKSVGKAKQTGARASGGIRGFLRRLFGNH